MIINEIFYSIQGEGKYTGLPTVFIRTTGCNLRCSFCDTKYAYEEGEKLTVNQIKHKIEKYKCKNICITGGEPLIQEEIPDLIKELVRKKYFITIETNGSIDIKPLINNKQIMISLDIKCPSSKMNEKMILKNIMLLEKKDQLKFIINDKKDYEYAKKITNEYKPSSMVFFQQAWGSNIEKLVKWILKDNLNVRLGLQMHKVIWGETKGK